MGEYGWVTVAEADTYFSTRYGASSYWGTSIPSSSNKIAALTTAYNQLVGCNLFEFPDTATQSIKNAQFEQALFIVIHQGDIDRRIGLQAQGVVAAGIVKETYKDGAGEEIPISPIAKRMLEYAGCLTARKMAYVMDIERDEDYDTDDNVVDSD